MAALVTEANGSKSMVTKDVYRHGESLLGFIDQLCSAQKIAINEVELISVVTGPGSFVGTRLGCAVAQALAFHLKVPIVAISTLHALAQSAYLKMPKKCIGVLQDARMGQVHYGIYTVTSEGAMVPSINAGKLAITDANLTQYTPDYWVGDGVPLCLQSNQISINHVLDDVEIDANALLILTKREVQQKKLKYAEDIEPYYG